MVQRRTPDARQYVSRYVLYNMAPPGGFAGAVRGWHSLARLSGGLSLHHHRTSIPTRQKKRRSAFGYYRRDYFRRSFCSLSYGNTTMYMDVKRCGSGLGDGDKGRCGEEDQKRRRRRRRQLSVVNSVCSSCPTYARKWPG